jgi:HAD superfamily hydrolase (TIGR01509 family)
MPGVKELMQKITESGILCCVVTGSGQRPLIQRILSDFGAYVHEEHITTAYDVQRGKPHPDPYLMGMQKAGTQPWETLVVENAPLGVQAGVAAQLFTIAVNTGPLPDRLLAEAGANLIFPRMTAWRDEWHHFYESCL